MTKIYIGTAGWTIPSFLKSAFPIEGTHLERYAQVFNAVEINSSFYREHRADTYRRWADSVPDDFRFSVKLAREFIHEARLRETGPALSASLDAISALGKKWGALLVQLPPSLMFDAKVAENFLTALKESTPRNVRIFWEPRHLSWAWAEAEHFFARHGFPRVWADPEPCPHRDAPERAVRYDRWHGSPKIYRSNYEADFLTEQANRLRSRTNENWCIFDNTTFGCATRNALELRALLEMPNQYEATGHHEILKRTEFPTNPAERLM